MGPPSLNDLIYSGPKASYLGPFLLSLVVEPTMALYTGSDILANRGARILAQRAQMADWDF